MSLDALPTLMPVIFAMLVTLAVGLYAWRRRAVFVARLFAIFAYFQATMVLGYAFELVSPTISAKLFWDNFQWIGTVGSVVSVLLFAHEHTEWRPRAYGTALRAIIALGVLSLATVFAEPRLGRIHLDPVLLPGDPFDALTYGFAPLLYLITGGLYLVLFWSIGVLVRPLPHAGPLYRAQTVPILLGVLLPVVGSIPTALGIELTFQRDVSPFTIAVGNVIVAWGLFRYKVFDLRPIARDAIVEHMEDGVVVVDNLFRIVDLNPVAQTWTSLRAGETLGQPLEAAFPLWLAVRQSASRVSRRFEVQENNRYLDLNLAALRDRNGVMSGWLIVARDITAHVLADRELAARAAQLARLNAEFENANAELHTLSRIKDEFVANVSHELRTPITNLKLYLDLLTRNPARSGQYQQTLSRETERLERLIEDLLTLSRLDRERITLNVVPVSINELVAQYAQDRRSLAGAKQLKLQLELADGLPLVPADPGLLSQVLEVLLTNSLNYTPAGGTITLTSARRQEEGQDWVGFKVADTGPGITLGDAEHLFTRFFRGAAGRDSGAAGTGLGLAIAREIVTRHHGQILLEDGSKPRKGACFAVWLPVAGQGAGETAEA